MPTLTKRNSELVRRAILDRTAQPVWMFYIDGAPTVLSDECGVSAEQALTLECDVPGRIGPEMTNAPLKVDVEIEGVTMRLFTGTLRRPEFSREAGESRLEGTSAFAFASDIPLGPPENDPREALDNPLVQGAVEFSGMRAEAVIRNVVARLPYDQRRVDVDRGLGPTMHRSGIDAYYEDTPCLQVIEEAEEHGDLMCFDTPLNGLRGIRTPGLGKPGQVDFSYDTARLEPGAFNVVPAEKQYAEVWVYDRNENGTRRARARAKVDHTRTPYPPPRGTALWIAMEGEDTDDEAAQKYASEQALEFSLGLHTFEISVPLNPLAGIGDVLKVTEDEETPLGELHTVYLCRILAYGHEKSTQMTTFSGDAHIHTQTLTPYPLETISGVSPGVHTSPPLNAPFLNWAQTDVEFDSPAMDVPYTELP